MANDQESTVPPRGWEIPRPPEAEADDEDPLAKLVEQLLALVPDELRVRVAAALHQLLEVLRALIDWCLARLDRRANSGPVEVRDIPIL